MRGSNRYSLSELTVGRFFATVRPEFSSLSATLVRFERLQNDLDDTFRYQLAGESLPRACTVDGKSGSSRSRFFIGRLLSRQPPDDHRPQGAAFLLRGCFPQRVPQLQWIERHVDRLNTAYRQGVQYGVYQCRRRTYGSSLAGSLDTERIGR